ncbi:MAG TPA: glycosyltransferase family 2 protein [Chthoniobacterales bacterium]|nr:glycosyltransferase family 2 protein [Chthoniobacterales bacterium]
MDQDIRLSVALIARNRPVSLERGLASLRAQGEQPFEVVVSDDSDSGIAPIIQKIASAFECRYLCGPRRGLYANRNAAFLLCQGTHIRTMDDDHILPPDHLSTCLAAVRSDPNAIWTTGEHGFIAGEFVGIARTANQLGPAGVGEPIERFDNNWGIADGSTIYPREVFDQGFRMVEEFGFGSTYLEFGAYLYQRGWMCRCIPGAVVEHHVDSLSRPDVLSQRFASICFNRYFRPNAVRLMRYIIPYWESWTEMPNLFEMAHRRWKTR